MRKETPSQTVGPFYAIGLTRKPMNHMVTEATRFAYAQREFKATDGETRRKNLKQ